LVTRALLWEKASNNSKYVANAKVSLLHPSSVDDYMIDLSMSSLMSEDQMIMSDPAKEKRRFDHKVLARKTAAQHQDNRRAFVTMNGCFSSKATKDPRFCGGETTAF
jgi:hypothetical protein